MQRWWSRSVLPSLASFSILILIGLFDQLKAPVIYDARQLAEDGLSILAHLCSEDEHVRVKGHLLHLVVVILIWGVH